jgi:RHS repeat-associated protein
MSSRLNIFETIFNLSALFLICACSSNAKAVEPIFATSPSHIVSSPSGPTVRIRPKLAGGQSISFDEFPVNTTINNQYAAIGVIFSGSGGGPFITTDGSNPSSPVLSGSPRFTGSINVFFVNPTNSTLPATANNVNFDSGYFDNYNSTVITWYGPNSQVLGSMFNPGLGIVHFAIPGNISGFTIQIFGTEVAGYAIDNLFYTISGHGSISGSGSAANSSKNPPENRPDSLVQEPIDTATGAHVIQRNLLKTMGAQDVEFTANYDSINRIVGVMGSGWSHNFEASLQALTNGSVNLRWNPKRSNLFTPSLNTNLLVCSDIAVAYHSLARNNDGSFTLKFPNQRHYEFDTAGRLQQIVNAHGQIIQLYYVATNLIPYQVQDAVSGKSLYFAYNNHTNFNLLTNITDNLNRSVSFGYDPSFYLTQITKRDGPTSQTWQYYYDSVGRIQYEYDPDGKRVFYDTYDASGRVFSQRNALDNYTYFDYDESRTNFIVTTVVDRTDATNTYVHDKNYLLLSLTDGLGHATKYGYDAVGNRTSVTNALGQVQRFAFDSSGNLVASTDAGAFTTRLRYDNHNNLTATTNAAGSKSAFAYDANNNRTSEADYLNNLTAMGYDGNGQLAQITSPRNGVTKITRSGGLIAAITDAATNTISMTYDAVGRLIAETNAAGFVTRYGFDLNDNLTFKSDGLGNVWQYTYDSARRKLTESDPLGSVTRFFYDDGGNLSATADASLNYTYYAYDGEQRLTQVQDANGNSRYLYYDAAGRLTNTRDAAGNYNQFIYDAVGNLVATVDGLGVTNQIISYDVRNQPVAIRDALGNTRRLAYDALQRLIRSVDGLNRTNQLAYDPLSHPISSTDPLNLTSQQQFDADGNRIKIINPKNAPYSFDHDLAGRLTGTSTATGKKTTYALDGRNLITQINQPSGAQTTLTYDGAGRLIQSQDPAGTIVNGYDAKGRLTSITENGRTITRQYDSLDRLVAYVDADGNVIGYAYDAVGNLTRLTYPDGKAVNYYYDANNRLVQVTDWGLRSTYYSYDANGRVAQIYHSNGSTTTRAYDAAGRLTRQQDVIFNPSTLVTTNVYTVKFAYDAAGQIVGETNLPPAAGYLPASVAMSYDADNALATYGGQAVARDANGNMTSGPLTNNTFAAYAYDARNRLTGAAGVAYTYDPAGNRVAIANNGATTRLVVNPNAALSQVLMRVQNGVTTYYVHGLGLLYEVTPNGGTSKVLTYHYDYRGSTVALTDDGGNVTDRMAHSPYGSLTARTGSNDTPFLFNGQFGAMTDANGLIFLRHRFYNTTLSRFINADPSGIWGGNNFFAYANGNPISFTDPFGLDTFDQESVLDYTKELLGKGEFQIDRLKDLTGHFAFRGLDMWGDPILNASEDLRGMVIDAKLRYWFNGLHGMSEAFGKADWFLSFGSEMLNTDYRFILSQNNYENQMLAAKYEAAAIAGRVGAEFFVSNIALGAKAAVWEAYPIIYVINGKDAANDVYRDTIDTIRNYENQANKNIDDNVTGRNISTLKLSP